MTQLSGTSHRTKAELDAGLDEIRRSPADDGILRLVVRRPAVGERETLETGEIDRVDGLLGDNWKTRPSSRSVDGSAHPDMQLNLMNARAAALIAGSEDRWALAGDQLFVDLDLSTLNLPPGTRLAIGDAVIEVTAQPHTGCAKFRERFGGDALRLVNSPIGREMNLRGVCAKVVRPGTITRGDRVMKVDDTGPEPVATLTAPG